MFLITFQSTSKPTLKNRTGNFKQGYYTPKNPDKYIGDVTKIRYMSSYEYNMHVFLDNNVRVLHWSSEPVGIPYIKPTDGKVHRYFPDYYVEYVNADGEIIQEIIEVKPAQQTRTPRSNHKHALYERVTFEINKAKWAYCMEWCKRKGFQFRIVTEKSIFR